VSRPDSRTRYADDQWPDAPDETPQAPAAGVKAREPRASTKRNRADAWMDQDIMILGRAIKRQTIAIWALRLPAFFGWFFILHPVLTANGPVLNADEADVLGTQSEINLILCLLITPLITITGQHWFASLRRWYGVMFGLTALSDATTAAITTQFAGGVFGRLAGHSFLLVGFTMVCLLLPLIATGNPWAQRKLGRYWKALHKLTYVIWGLLWLHLALLEGLGFQMGTNGSGNCPPCDGDPIMHQRLYQLTEVSLFLLILRLPPVKRWIAAQQKAGQQWLVYVAITPLFLLFMLGFTFILNEEFFKGGFALRNLQTTE
jgi:DMSO/TMAO reductase YedYZ heme-binding membrane subunit